MPKTLTDAEVINWALQTGHIVGDYTIDEIREHYGREAGELPETTPVPEDVTDPTYAEALAWGRTTGHVPGPEFDGNPDFRYTLAYLRKHYQEQQAAEDAEDDE